VFSHHVSKIDKIFCNACSHNLEGEYVVISIKDSGCGISPEKINHIFEPFFTTKEIGKGTGLGLSVSSGILHNVDAHVVVESEIDKGTTFSLFFPPVHKSDVHNKNADDVANVAVLSSTLKICVVDDEDDISFLLQEELSNLGHIVQTFSNGVEAFKYVNEHLDYFDVIITDYGMPLMNGLEFTNKVLEKRPDIPILICTGYSSKLKTPNDLPKGNVFLFKKPVGVDMLDMTIKKLFIGK
jgi:CheY-like chemotaxis protein